jgi:hypothetical protein
VSHLRAAENDKEFQEQVESAIASENQVLLEERAAMAKQIEDLKAEKKQVEQTLEKQKQEATTEISKAQELLQERERAAAAKLAEIETNKLSAEIAAKQEAIDRERAERLALRTAKIASITIALLVNFMFEVIINRVWQWEWLLLHPNSYGLQASLCFMAFFGIVGLWVKPWRKALWGVGLFGILFVVLQLLGGPAKKNER